MACRRSGASNFAKVRAEGCTIQMHCKFVGLSTIFKNFSRCWAPHVSFDLSSESEIRWREILVAMCHMVGLPDSRVPETCLEETSACAALKVVGLSLQNDATNSEIWHRKKLTSLAVEVSVLTDLDKLGCCDYVHAFHSDRYLKLASGFRVVEF